MGSTPVTYIDSAGCHVPPFADILSYLQGAYRSIYGSDVYIDPDSQDGQILGLFATAINDANAMAASVYNAFSPSTAQGAGLSSVVKINGIERETPTNSTVDLTLGGTFNTELTDCSVQDPNGNYWDLPGSVTIPISGQIIATATCRVQGDISAPAGTTWKMSTPTRGWQTVSNATDAAPGEPVELDPALRVRQSISAGLPSLTVIDGIQAAILQISGVSAVRGYENDTDITDVNGMPEHSLSFVVQGGDDQAIINAIGLKKTPGGATYGSTTGTFTNTYGISKSVNFFRPTYPTIAWNLTVKALSGFTQDVQNAIAQAVSDWTNALGIGNSIAFSRAYGPALLIGQAGASTFEIQSIAVGRDGNTPTSADITIAFNEWASCMPSSVTFVITS